jgi:hypothetical protein
MAVQKNGSLICYIQNPSEEVQLAAVKQEKEAIKYIKRPFREVLLAAKNL